MTKKQLEKKLNKRINELETKINRINITLREFIGSENGYEKEYKFYHPFSFSFDTYKNQSTFQKLLDYLKVEFIKEIKTEEGFKKISPTKS